MSKTIEISIDADGNASMDIVGCSDNSCQKIVDDLKLGKVVDHRKKPEYNSRLRNNQTTRG